jgi:hypothetical protein
VAELSANSGLTGSLHKACRAGLCHQAPTNSKRTSFFSARLRATIPNAVNDDIGIELKVLEQANNDDSLQYSRQFLKQSRLPIN